MATVYVYHETERGGTTALTVDWANLPELMGKLFGWKLRATAWRTPTRSRTLADAPIGGVGRDNWWCENEDDS